MKKYLLPAFVFYSSLWYVIGWFVSGTADPTEWWEVGKVFLIAFWLLSIIVTVMIKAEED